LPPRRKGRVLRVWPAGFSCPHYTGWVKNYQEDTPIRQPNISCVIGVSPASCLHLPPLFAGPHAECSAVAFWVVDPNHTDWIVGCGLPKYRLLAVNLCNELQQCYRVCTYDIPMSCPIVRTTGGKLVLSVVARSRGKVYALMVLRGPLYAVSIICTCRFIGARVRGSESPRDVALAVNE